MTEIVTPEMEEHSLLWWVVIVYMFVAQAEVCDEYFVESIKEILRKYSIPEEVAGATLMALGCNGPELFTNCISLFITHSDLGVGTIVGSEIFNLLCIIGGCALVSPSPPQIHKYSFYRDTLFYLISIILLGFVMHNNIIDVAESLVLLFFGLLFVLTVTFSPIIEKRFFSHTTSVNNTPQINDCITISHDASPVCISLARHNRLLDSHLLSQTKCLLYYTNNGDIPGFKISLSRLNSQSINANIPNLTDRRNSDAMLHTMSRSLLPKTLSDTHNFIPFSSIVSVSVVLNRCLIDLTLRHKSYGYLYSLSIYCLNISEFNKILSVLPDNKRHGNFDRRHVAGLIQESIAEVRDGNISIFEKMMTIIKFPIDLVLSTTLSWCDVRTHPDRWLYCFIGSMLWLACFSYIMCVSAEYVHEDLHISQGIMGVTVVALGTSFPNFWASIRMAKEGRSGIAIANALGSNIQNIFIALAIPWFFAVLYSGGEPIYVKSKGIYSGILWMAITLIVVFTCVLGSNFQLNRSTGYFCIVLYIIYVISAVGVVD